MAQSGMDERAGADDIQQPPALAARSVRGGMGVGFVYSGRAGFGGGSAANMVSGLLSLFGKAGICHQPDYGIWRAGSYFLRRGHAAGIWASDAGQKGPFAFAPRGGREELLEGSPTRNILGTTFLRLA